ncbi:hypothetical protein JRO89_XS05G0137100 [Xanthoceras sorbifolium]|uniref:Uncharacterized protein n=1 Tax=Xanthoceras sorbifolium TaxID=99658 RepID=A0ABQ8I273_9ROSI|nr:hypothetical protein JRO89_XS05G0137100 [Xanthoceras sorbifolium]
MTLRWREMSMKPNKQVTRTSPWEDEGFQEGKREELSQRMDDDGCQSPVEGLECVKICRTGP